jgi:hypothetical protein
VIKLKLSFDIFIFGLLAGSISLESHAAPTAFLISGGIRPTSNYCRYYQNLERANRTFAAPAWNRINLVADGAGTLANSVECDAEGKVVTDSDGRPKLTRHDPPGGVQGAATAQEISRLVREQVKSLQADDPVVIYVTDHGDIENKRVLIRLWHEDLTIEQFREVIRLIPDSHRIVLMQDQCFGGGMLEALWNTDGSVKPNTCGIAAASATEPAFDGGGIMRTIDETLQNQGKDGEVRADEIHQLLLKSSEIYSAPVATSDLFLEKYLLSHPVQANTSPCLPGIESMTELSATASASLKALLEKKRANLTENLQTQLKRSELDPSTNFSAVDTRLMTAQARVDALEHKAGQLKKSVDQAYARWMAAEHTNLVLEYDKSRKAVLSLRQQLAALSDQSTANRSELENSLRTAEVSFEALHLEVSRYKYGRDKLESFQKFVKTQGGLPGYSFKKSALDDFKKVDALRSTEGKKITKLRALRHTLGHWTGLKALIDSKDSFAMTQYLSMLECESFKVGGKLSAQSGAGK